MRCSKKACVSVLKVFLASFFNKTTQAYFLILQGAVTLSTLFKSDSCCGSSVYYCFSYLILG